MTCLDFVLTLSNIRQIDIPAHTKVGLTCSQSNSTVKPGGTAGFMCCIIRFDVSRNTWVTPAFNVDFDSINSVNLALVCSGISIFSDLFSIF